MDESEHDLLQNYLVVTSNGVNSGFVTYHPERFAIVQDAFALRLLSDADLTESLALFLCAVLIKNNENYNWDNKSKWNLLKNDVVLLPVTDSGEPDWDFMESYMAEVNQEVQDRVAVVQSVESPHHEIDVSGWKEFRILDYFEYGHGSRLNSSHRIEGDIPFVTAGKVNQGVATHIGNSVETFLDPITVDMFGNCFFQNGECAGDDNVYFFASSSLSATTKQFLAVAIQASNRDYYSFDRQFRKDDAFELTIPLPATDSGEPDWEFMESYMQSVMNDVERSTRSTQQGAVELSQL